MFIAIDIGNTNITVSVKTGNEWEEHRISSVKLEPLQFYTQQLINIAEILDLSELEGVGVSSVVPSLTNIILDASENVLHKTPLLIEKKWYHLLPISTPNPDEMGTDLLLNALAAYQKFLRPTLIVDFGTALTYTLINDKQSIEGVAIAPGISTSMNALAGNAAQLPEISLVLPDKYLGMNTAEAMSAGILWGYVGQVNYMIDSIKASYPYKINTVATGGLSEVLKPLSKSFDEIDRNLTVSGIYHFFKLVQESHS